MWSSDLKIILEQAYEPLAKIDLKTASPSQFDEVFSRAYPGADNVIRKCKTFYLAAATEAKIPISPYIMRNKKPRSGPSKKRTARLNGEKTDRKDGGLGDDGQKSRSMVSQKLSEQVLTILDMKNLTDDEENAVFTLLKYLRKEGK